MSDSALPVVGFIGLGDQGLPMATAIAAAGFQLHVWARRPSSLDGLAGVPHVPHTTVRELAEVVDIVDLCVSTDQDVLRIVVEDLLPYLRAGSIVVNHGTGTPKNAARLAQLGGQRGAPRSRSTIPHHPRRRPRFGCGTLPTGICSVRHPRRAPW